MIFFQTWQYMLKLAKKSLRKFREATPTFTQRNYTSFIIFQQMFSAKVDISNAELELERLDLKSNNV